MRALGPASRTPRRDDFSGKAIYDKGDSFWAIVRGHPGRTNPVARFLRPLSRSDLYHLQEV